MAKIKTWMSSQILQVLFKILYILWIVYARSGDGGM